jgi:CubicO group peptidase (beta-lactamase class C family)
MAVHLLAQRGLLDLDEPVATHWPEYASHGKGTITPRQVLTHRAGVPASFGHLGLDLAMMADWDRSVRAAEGARPRWAAGQVVAYHTLSFGFILGELVRRVSGRPITQFVAEELFEPLGMDAFLALAPSQRHRAIPVRPHRGNVISPAFVNSERVRGAVVPAASMRTTARSLAAFYRMMLADGVTQTGRPLFTPASVRAALAVSADGVKDRTLRQRQRYGQGFQLGGLPGVLRGLGRRSPPGAFGRGGSGACLAWAEPERRLVFIYLSNTIDPITSALRFAAALSDAAWSAFTARSDPPAPAPAPSEL